MYSKYDNMQENGMFYALIGINNHGIAIIGCMLSCIVSVVDVAHVSHGTQPINQQRGGDY